MTPEDSIRIRTDFFDGPLSLLLLLIQKQEMSLRDLDISAITQQYIDFLSQMQELNFDVAGDYLLMAATLVLLKSKSCLSEEEEEELLSELEIDAADVPISSREDLIKRLLTLHRFQKTGQLLWSLPKRGMEVFCRPKANKKLIKDSILTPLELNELTQAMTDVLRRQKRRTLILKKDQFSIKKKIDVLKRFLKKGLQVSFKSLMTERGAGETALTGKVLTFISLLELARLHKVSLSQNNTMGDIAVDVREDLDFFDASLADGFDAVTEAPPQPLH